MPANSRWDLIRRLRVNVPYFLIAVFVIVDGYLVIINNVQCSFLYRSDDC